MVNSILGTLASIVFLFVSMQFYAESRPILILGDSLSQGLNLAQVDNEGHGGRTSAMVLQDWNDHYHYGQWSALVVWVGTNDIANGVSLQEFQNNIHQLSYSAQSYRVSLFVISILPVTGHRLNKRPIKAIQVIDRWLRQDSAFNGYKYLDLTQVVSDDQGLLNNRYTDDGLHLNAAGYALIQPIIQEALAWQQ